MRARRGTAMVLVMIAVAVSLVLATSFLAVQSVSTGLAQNVERRARARAVAESGLAMTVASVGADRTWRSRVPEGTWIADQWFAGGRFSVRGEDGADENGDGIVDGDGDLRDDESDPVTLTAVGTVDGVSHTVQAVLSPTLPRSRVLMVVPDPGRLGVNDQRRATQFEAWRFDVALIDDRAGQAAFDAAAAAADVVYVPESVYAGNLGAKLRDVPVGVVIEENYVNREMGLSSRGGAEYTRDKKIDVEDAGHFITQTVGEGKLRLVTRRFTRLRYVAGSPAPDAVVLAERERGGAPVLVALDAGGRLADGGRAAGRRVALPVGGTRFDWRSLTADGLTLVERAMRWAAEPVERGAIARWTLDDLEGSTAVDTVGGVHGDYRKGVTLGAASPLFLGTFAVFDGRNDHVEVPHDKAFLLDEGTVAFWFRTDRPGRRQGLVSKDSDRYDAGGQFSIFVHRERVTSVLESVDAAHRLTSGPIGAQTWHHVAFSFGPAGMKLFVDGALAASDPYAGGLGKTSGGKGNSEPMAFGVLTDGSGNRKLSRWEAPLSGAMNDVRVFDRALGDDEIERLAAGPALLVRWVEHP